MHPSPSHHHHAPPPGAADPTHRIAPRVPALDAGPDPELREMTRRLWIAAAFTLPLFAITMSEMLGASIVAGRTRIWLALALALPVCTWAAWPFYVRFAQSLRHRSLNMFTLIGLGVGVAFGYSLAAALVPAALPPPSASTTAPSAPASRPPA
jgi:Cu+-exporting ATPase